MNQQMHIYEHVQRHIYVIILHQHISVTLVSITRVSYNRKAIRTQIIAQRV